MRRPRQDPRHGVYRPRQGMSEATLGKGLMNMILLYGRFPKFHRVFWGMSEARENGQWWMRKGGIGQISTDT